MLSTSLTKRQNRLKNVPDKTTTTIKKIHEHLIEYANIFGC